MYKFHPPTHYTSIRTFNCRSLMIWGRNKLNTYEARENLNPKITSLLSQIIILSIYMTLMSCCSNCEVNFIGPGIISSVTAAPPTKFRFSRTHTDNPACRKYAAYHNKSTEVSLSLECSWDKQLR